MSRKRKKTPKANAAVKAARRRAQLNTQVASPPADMSASPDLFSRILADRAGFDARRLKDAAPVAAALVAELTGLAPRLSDADLEDELCVRLGTILVELDDRRPVERSISPDIFAEALLDAAASAVRAATGAEVRPAAGRVLAVIAGVLPDPFGDAAIDVLANLRNGPPGEDLPEAPPQRSLAGEILVVRDRYGSRFGIAAPFASGTTPRWYLWDVDACDLQPLTVYSGFYPSPDAALAAWQEGVGTFAAAGTTWGKADDFTTLRQLLPVSEGPMRLGGETPQQFAEYYRSRRLAETVRLRPEIATAPEPHCDTAGAATTFAAWLDGQETGLDSADLPDIAASLAEIWKGITGVAFDSCSPHRVAYAIRYIHDDYQDSYGDMLLAALPHWIRWLAERTGATTEMVDRALQAVRVDPDIDANPQVRHTE